MDVGTNLVGILGETEQNKKNRSWILLLLKVWWLLGTTCNGWARNLKSMDSWLGWKPTPKLEFQDSFDLIVSSKRMFFLTRLAHKNWMLKIINGLDENSNIKLPQLLHPGERKTTLINALNLEPFLREWKNFNIISDLQSKGFIFVVGILLFVQSRSGYLKVAS